MKLSVLQIFYGALAFAGLGATWTFNVLFTIHSGWTFNLIDFLRGAFANHASSSISVDILVVVCAFTAWIFVEARRVGMRRPWVYLVLTFSVALAFSFPLFLLMRERTLARDEERKVIA